ncbi:hypothetical protein XSR1_290008 [Xenorhabdus szentirmaii DSM 16338]|uniref:Uncharacterized protein n=1 Tax=Xenorhabdus szentirmaii DSM 16338 TaxID=1427518 RepID=W1J0V2_9GAMM|nr:hypothetical protein XSR1_290008 [Xenorhabdus szentirmaii DSM 16338]
MGKGRIRVRRYFCILKLIITSVLTAPNDNIMIPNSNGFLR